MRRDLGGNSINSAKVLNVGASIREWVGHSDRRDFYQITINERSLTSFGLRSSSSASIALLNSNGNVISTSTANGRQTQVSGDLDPGTYYIRIASRSVSARYVLSSSSVGLPPRPVIPIPEPGLSTFTAYNTGELNEKKAFQDSLGWLDQRDYYRFTLTQMSSFKASFDFDGPVSNVKLLYDQNNDGSIDYEIWGDERLADIETPLAAGTYFVALETPYTEQSRYTMTLSATPTGDPSGVDPGNTPATATNLGLLTGSRTLNGFVGTDDEHDYYRFTLDRPTDIKATYSGGALASISGGGKTYSLTPFYPGNIGSLNQTLMTGEYTIQIFYNYQISNYSLNITAI